MFGCPDGKTQPSMLGIIILHCGGRMWIDILRCEQSSLFPSILVLWQCCRVANRPPPLSVSLSVSKAGRRQHDLLRGIAGNGGGNWQIC